MNANPFPGTFKEYVPLAVIVELEYVPSEEHEINL